MISEREEMTIAEAITLKWELETKIVEMCTQYTLKTGVTVESIYLSSDRNEANVVVRYAVEVTAEL
jgi:hypothetical protein